MRSLIALFLLAPGVAAADELKNDTFMTNDTVAFQGGFAAGEIAAARFVTTDVATLEKVQLLFGPSGTRTITLKVWDDSGGGMAPGTALASEDYEIVGSISAMHELILPTPKVVPPQFRVGIVLTAGSPSVANDTEAQTPSFPDRNFIMETTSVWGSSSTFGVKGDWIIRALTAGGGAPGDAGATGGDCSGNADCPTGQFCDTAQGACTFECREDPDCGGGTCNSLGQCVGGGGGDGGGCCQTDRSNGAGALLLAGIVGLFAFARRRRT